MDHRRDGGKSVLIDQKQKWFLIGDDLLHAVECLLASLNVAGRSL